ncbi:hypothetical protein T05_6845 [Trichinella murrelli]|uniref:Uncharacterized protein n=1 Tax=Trichinella murrelli TaxID=144512 RepID=A0A0V0TLH2_9BILA|nr:hypothetical protein T05_6845 [Trichinella murrelli]
MPDGSWGKSLALAFDKGKYVSAFAPIYVSNSEWPNLGLGRHPQRQSCSIEAEAPVALTTYLSPVAIALVMLISYNITDRRYQHPFSNCSTFDIFVSWYTMRLSTTKSAALWENYYLAHQSFPKVGTLCLSVKCDLSKNFPMLLHTAYNALTTLAIIILLVWITLAHINFICELDKSSCCIIYLIEIHSLTATIISSINACLSSVQSSIKDGFLAIDVLSAQHIVSSSHFALTSQLRVNLLKFKRKNCTCSTVQT